MVHKSFLLLMLLFVLFVLPVNSFAQNQDMNLGLSKDGLIAYNLLLKAEQFEDKHLGYVGKLSTFVEAFRKLLTEPSADGAFKSLLEKATLPGQLYALCGIYFTDNNYFHTVIGRYIQMQDMINVQNGCLGGIERISVIVQSNEIDAVRLDSPSQSFEEWERKNRELAKRGFTLDIIGGGYPSYFRE